MNRRLYTIILTLTLAALIGLPALAAAPVGNETFELIASPFTGGDNTGDGGTGLPADLNYYYVGQTFTTAMRIKAGGTDAANIWIDYNSAKLTASNLLNGTYFPSYSGQNIMGGRVYLTGFRTSGVSSGTGNFGWVDWTVDAPAAAAYGLGSPELLDINVGIIGNTTESNIALGGLDLLDDEEDFALHLWADTVKPFAENPNPANAAIGVAVESNFTFDLRDTLNGEGDNTGVGTGVNTAEPPGAIAFHNGTATSDYSAYDSFSCSGIWGTNYCAVTVNPPSPSGIPGDSRNFEYSTTYTVMVSGFQDKASPVQNQLGDANGPNTMNPKIWTFVTEADTVPPRVTYENPARGSTGASVSTNITIDIEDRKTYPGTISGTGVAPATCRFNVSSPSFSLTTYEQGDAGVTVVPINYGYRFVIDPASDFLQNETVTVSAYDCEDLASNVMITDTWTFTTADTSAPYVDQVAPANDTLISKDAVLRFHIKDDGGGVDLSQVVIYLNGVYYSNGGGAGQVTVSGTRITFADSLDFNGGNYPGDTTSLSGTPADYTFTLDPQADFAVGEAVPVIIYAKDADNNIMERYVYALAVEDPSAVGPCPVCPSGGGAGGGGQVYPEINESTVSVIQIDEDSVLVSWNTNYPGSSMVLYDLYGHDELLYPPSYGYQYFTMEYGVNSLYHAVVIDGLSPGTLYYFRPVSHMNGEYYFGHEVLMAPRFASIEIPCPASEPGLLPGTVCPVCPECSASPVYIISPDHPAADPSKPSLDQPTLAEGILRITKIEVSPSLISLQGLGLPNSTVTLLIDPALPRPAYEASLRTDAAGVWEIELANNLSSGAHAVLVFDQDGRRDQGLIFVQALSDDSSRLGSSLTQRYKTGETKPLLPPVFAYGIFFLLLIITALASYLVNLGNKIDQEIAKRKRQEARTALEASLKAVPVTEKYQRQDRYLRRALAVAILAVAASLIFGLLLNYQTGVFERLPAPPPIDTTIVSVSGALKSPFEEQGVPGVDVVAGATRIRTDQDGWYSFSDIILQDGIRLTHPQLSRPVVAGLEALKTPGQAAAKAFPVKIYFDVELFNTLSRIADFEARGRIDDLYGLIAPSIQAKLSAQEFAKSHPILFGSEDLAFQELRVSGLTPHNHWTSTYNFELNRVVAVTLANRQGQQAIYHLMQDHGRWYLVR